ncbi:hypothetical protein DQ04_00391120 [Trypanosoma grayi]|uniref:hypothetical protein n=1 Tax=Trypanosoma grayi TaxID=71804 RepID=UPI0004F44F65|nr:hypothetical protein DQ04_00391120 [Trypanosoma grayi]KEG14590.1 hypothetical protein DQ04_00391120 [Trypanosoma grayi]
MIISEGTPMTNGEVYALLRRNRDERNGKLLPPFGLQFVGSSSTPQMQQQRATASSTASTSVRASLFFPPEGLLTGGGAAGVVSTTPLHSATSSALFASPTVSHLMVLLTEVRALRYLGRYATTSGDRALQRVYGPTSIHSHAHRRPGAADGNGDATGGEPDAISTEEKALRRVLQQYRPGTVAHVWALESLLSLWEVRGREMESSSANGVKAALRAVRERFATSSDGNGNGNGDLSATVTDEEGQKQRPPSLDQPRMLFAKPSLPLAQFLADQPPTAVTATSGRESGGAAAVTTVVASQEHRQWTEQDVLRLVMARPQNSLDVHRVVDSLEEYVGQCEELMTFLEEELVKLFVSN